MLEVTGLSKTFYGDNQREILKGIDLSVDEGKFVCIIGQSGCGKTILLYLLAGFLKPTSGKITLDGRELTNPSTDRIMVFQDYVLLPWKTVYENVLFGLEKTDIPKSKKNELVESYLDLVGLADFKSWYPHKLSGGMKQRVAIARALVSNPKILLMDEPFSALDPQYRKYMRKYLEAIWQKTRKTIVFVTHSINEALYLADTIHVVSGNPSTIVKTYNINAQRPRDVRSSKLSKIASDIEKNITVDSISVLDEEINNKILKKLLSKR